MRNIYYKDQPVQFGLMNIVLLHSDHWHVRPLVWTSAGWYEQKDIFIMCPVHFTVKNQVILVKIPVKW